jgi:hypothetical protein
LPSATYGPADKNKIKKVNIPKRHTLDCPKQRSSPKKRSGITKEPSVVKITKLSP